MKNIMLSIRPEWLQKILSGQKTVELRLSRPNLTPPFMVFLYCSCKGTKKPGEILEIHSGGVHKQEPVCRLYTVLCAIIFLKIFVQIRSADLLYI